jgi:hypothetical protein
VSLTQTEKLATLDLLEGKINEHVERQSFLLLREKTILETVLNNQGISDSLRRSANVDKIKVLASVRTILG